MAAQNGSSIFPLIAPTVPLAAEFNQDNYVQMLQLINSQCVAGSAGSLTNPTIAGTLTFNGSVAGTTTLAATGSATGALTLPAPSASDTLVALNLSQTLTNKTLGSGAGTAVTIVDGGNVAIGTGTGTQIGTAVGSKIGFWGVAPVVQQSLTSFAAATTTAATTAAGIYGFTTAAQPAGIISLLNQLRVIAVATGLAVGP